MYACILHPKESDYYQAEVIFDQICAKMDAPLTINYLSETSNKISYSPDPKLRTKVFLANEILLGGISFL